MPRSFCIGPKSVRSYTAHLLLVASAIACRPAPEPPPPPTARQTPRIIVFAPGQQLGGSPALSDTTPSPEPTATYPSLQAACGAVNAIMEARLGVGIKQTDAVQYENEFVQAHRTGCELRATGKLSVRPDTVGSRSVDGDVAAGLEAAGWADIPRYTADGPDGGSFGDEKPRNGVLVPVQLGWWGRQRLDLRPLR